MKDIHEQIEEISNLLKNDPSRKKLKELNNLLENDEEVIRLSEELKRLEREYSSLLNQLYHGFHRYGIFSSNRFFQDKELIQKLSQSY